MQYARIETLSPPAPEIIKNIILSDTLLPVNPPPKLGKPAIRSSLKASTWDGVFAAIFSSITGGVLLSNFLLQLGASAIEIGMISSVPMLVNLLQPLGAYLADRTTSRRWYSLCIYCPSRLLWLLLVLAIGWNCWHHSESHALVGLTLAMVWASNLMGALGSASWLSWMAALVPLGLRGRYFGFRNSAVNLTNLIGVPLLGLVVSVWPGGTLFGYSVVLSLGVLAGVISIGFQFFMMADVNPQAHRTEEESESGRAGEGEIDSSRTPSLPSTSHRSRFCLEANFLRFLLYVAFWTFAVNVSNPFFNLYMLDNLAVDVRWVTIYGSLMAGSSLLMLVVWGKIADRIGNRPVLIFVGVLVALTPLLWLGTGSNSVSLWVWFPLLHLLMGGTGCAIDLCNNNFQMALAPARNQSTYFAIVAAVAGVGGALGTTLGGFLAQFYEYGGLPVLFALSAVLRLIALLPLVFVQEKRSQSLVQVMRLLVRLPLGRSLLPLRSQQVPVQVAQLANRSE